MFTRKEKEALNDIARSIQEVYNFSLIPEDKNFKRPEEITRSEERRVGKECYS